jgi:hypothetical protein
MGVMYRDLFRNPRKVAARTKLEYLRAAKMHLDSQLENSDVFPQSLKALFASMLRSAEELVGKNVVVA